MRILYKCTASYSAPAVMNVIIQCGPDCVVYHYTLLEPRLQSTHPNELGTHYTEPLPTS